MGTFEIEHDGKKFRVQAANQADAMEALGMHTGKSPEPGLLETAGKYFEKAVQPITDYPETSSRMNKEARDQMSRGVDQIMHPGDLTSREGTGLSSVLTGAANVGLGAAGFVGSPFAAALETVVGKPIEENTGIPKEYTDFAASMALPMPKSLPRLRVPPVTRSPKTADMLGVTLSEGQATGDLSAIQREQAALRGQSGPPSQKIAQEFTGQQGQQIERARGDIATQLDPAGQRVAETPQAAGQMVSDQLQRTATQRKTDVTAAYDKAKSYPGEVHAKAFDDIGTSIKTDLSSRAEPIIIDDKLTPFASHAIKDIEGRVANLKIQNRASPHPDPTRAQIVGVDLNGIDQMRKRLSAFRKDAYGSGNAADGRAAQAVLDAFDNHIDGAINGGMFRGDPRAIGAWNDARAFYADYRKTFTAGKNDPIGRVVEKIIGKGGNPAAIPNDVADFMYGTAGVNPTSLNVGVVSRLKSTFGDRSPEWSSIKQGLFSRLTETGEGMKDLGPGKVAERINKFLSSDGKEMANVVFSPAERDMIQKYADLMRKIEVPQAGANWSNTATFAAKALDKIGTHVGVQIGAGLGALLGSSAGLPHGMEAGYAAGAAVAKGGSMASNAMQARKIASQMPIVGKVMTNYQHAVTAYSTTPSARNAARMSIAARNLSTNLKDVGINLSPENLLRAIQGPVPGRAGDENPKPPRVGDQ